MEKETSQKIKAKVIGETSIKDPDSLLMVDVQLIKLETGGIIGIDSSFLANTDEPIYSPFDERIELELTD